MYSPFQASSESYLYFKKTSTEIYVQVGKVSSCTFNCHISSITDQWLIKQPQNVVQMHVFGVSW